MIKDDNYFMAQALSEAEKAYHKGEVPIGAVVVKDGEVIGRGHNLRETTQNAITHAEMIAIQEANRCLENWRLENCDLYVTVEPCPMCSGAILLSRVRRVVYGVPDLKAGTCGTLMNLLQDDRFNHVCEVDSGVMAEESRYIIQSFFKELRKRKKQSSEDC